MRTGSSLFYNHCTWNIIMSIFVSVGWLVHDVIRKHITKVNVSFDNSNTFLIFQLTFQLSIVNFLWERKLLTHLIVRLSSLRETKANNGEMSVVDRRLLQFNVEHGVLSIHWPRPLLVSDIKQYSSDTLYTGIARFARPMNIRSVTLQCRATQFST